MMGVATKATFEAFQNIFYRNAFAAHDKGEHWER
jgi:hypothetical protein